MKKYLIYVLTAALILSFGFGVKKQLQVKSLNQAIQTTEAKLINGFHNKPNLNYSFSLIEKEPTKENLETLAKELSFTQNFFESVILLNEKKINDAAWQRFQKARTNIKAVNYILSLSTKTSLEQKDKDNLKRIREVYNTFYKNMSNDTSFDRVNNVNSLTASYVEFMTQLEDIF